jgi:hypothetical protein
LKKYLMICEEPSLVERMVTEYEATRLKLSREAATGSPGGRAMARRRIKYGIISAGL